MSIGRILLVSKQIWTAELLTDFYREDLSRAGMQTILDWAIANNRFEVSDAKAPLFSILGHSGRKLFAVFSSGHIYVWHEEDRFDKGISDRDLLVAELKSMSRLSSKAGR